MESDKGTWVRGTSYGRGGQIEMWISQVNDLVANPVVRPQLPLLFNQTSVCTHFESYLASRFSSSLANFATTGHPGTGWLPYSLSSPNVLEFQRDGKIRLKHEREIRGRDDEEEIKLWKGLAERKVAGWEGLVPKL